MANPTFYPSGHTPLSQDTRMAILQKILGAIIDTFSPVNVNPTFLVPPGHTPNPGDTEMIVLLKILGAIIDSTGGASALTGNFSGIGSPNGVVTASPSASYLDITDTNSPKEWKKTTGVNSNTGWINFAGMVMIFLFGIVSGFCQDRQLNGTYLANTANAIITNLTLPNVPITNLLRLTAQGSITNAKIGTGLAFDGTTLSANGSIVGAGGGNTQTTGSTTSTNIPYYLDSTITNIGPSTAIFLNDATNFVVVGNVIANGFVSANGMTITSLIFDDGSGNTLRISPPNLSTDINLITDTAPGTGFWFGTVTGTTNETITHIGSSGSGNVVRVTSATLVTPTLGAATATSINGLTISSSTGTLTISNGKVVSVTATLTFAGTDGSTVTFGAGGTVAYTANKLSVFAATSSAELAGVITGETGTDALVFANTPTLVAPVLGIATATTVNKVTLTAPASGSTLTIADGKTLTVSQDTTLNRQSSTGLPVEFGIAVGDETTTITTGTAKVTFRAPYAFTVTEVRASLTAASSSGLPTFDINEGGTTILSTKLTIDANELTSTTAATPPVISDSAIADDAEITIDIDVAGTGAKGPKIWIKGYR